MTSSVMSSTNVCLLVMSPVHVEKHDSDVIITCASNCDVIKSCAVNVMSSSYEMFLCNKNFAHHFLNISLQETIEPILLTVNGCVSNEDFD